MDEFFNQIQALVPENFDCITFLKALAISVGGFLILSIIGRLFLGRKSALSQSISAAIGILFVYAVTILIFSYGISLDFLVSPLPFISISGDYLHIFNIVTADYVNICGQVLNMIILAFLVNMVNSWLPSGKKFFGWLFFRVLSVGGAMLLHALVQNIIYAFLPEGLLTWAPVILLGLLVLMLAVGALKFLVGLIISTVNPLVGFLYTFFFANAVGKQLTRSMLTTLLFCGLIYAMNQCGIVSIFIGSVALAAYLPMIIVFVILWYIVAHKL
ncbi:MAG: hypothetical protein IJF02_00780 [Oscillospiraceae bacterium]|nr:hypothetical protein [Oscillospiraceae bacterium]